MGRRELLRIQAEIEIHFTSFDHFYKEYTKNISKGGIFVKTNNPLAPQTVIAIKLFLPGSQDPLNLVAEVVHVLTPEIAKLHNWDPGMGLHFVDYDAATAKRLEQYISDQIKLNPQVKDERRKHQRFSTHIRLKFPDVATFKGSYASDISQGGIFIPTTNPKPVGTKISLSLVHPQTQEEVQMAGEIVRVITEQEAQQNKDLTPGMGIKFINMTPERQQALQKFLM